MEFVYHYLWKNRLFGLHPALDSGETVDVLDPGLSNSDAGPDFFNAKVRIGGLEWAGNVEIHTAASDWYRHNHQDDPLYDTVILHVVGKSDREVTRSDGSVIPQMTVSVPDGFRTTYADLCRDLCAIRCASRIGMLEPLNICDVLSSMGTERLEEKARRILDRLQKAGGDWNCALFIVLARALGFGLNSQPMEMLAESIPLGFILRHSDQLLQIEALLFGQAGLLAGAANDDYTSRLQREYGFLKAKYGLTPLRPEVWRFARTRPQNFPHRRIALLAKALHGGFGLSATLQELATDRDRLRKHFMEWEAGEYWRTHSAFGHESGATPCRLSRASAELLMVNVAAPYLYALASRHGSCEMAEAARDLLTSLPAERNRIIVQWGETGICAENAYESQALLHLKKEYCDRNGCLRCRLGNSLLRRAAKTI